MRNISKSFDGVQVLDSVCLSLDAGEIHILAGENGAGKSTLIKILGGVYQSFSGTIHLEDNPVWFASPHDAARQGIAVIHQEMSLVDSMSVLDNLFLGRELCRAGIWLSRKQQIARAKTVLQSLDVSVNIFRPVESYPVAIRQMIEAARVLLLDARVVVFDEPTSALNDHEVKKLFRVIASLKSSGCAIVYITHKMEEIFTLGDRITVLRDGKQVGTSRIESISPDTLVEWMVGRTVSAQFPERICKPGNTCLAVSNFSSSGPETAHVRKRKPVSFSVREGEIVGFAGLQGSGSSNLFSALFGAARHGTCGTVVAGNERLSLRSPRHCIKRGIGMLPDDRGQKGIIPGMSVTGNISLASLVRCSSFGWIQSKRERAMALALIQHLSIRLESPVQDIKTLSGGNQQKTILARWLLTDPRILLLNEPTRGIDVGAKHEIYELMNRLTGRGIAILLITSEMPELLAMSDRILVMHRGEIVRELSRQEATQERVLKAAMGSNSKEEEV